MWLRADGLDPASAAAAAHGFGALEPARWFAPRPDEDGPALRLRHDLLFVRDLRDAHPRVRRVARVRQVHGNDVCVLARDDDPDGIAADALVTNRPHLALTVRTADCVPVLIAGPGAVGAVHAGRRGLVADVVGRAVAALADRFGVRPAALTAIVGPCISTPRYPVDDATAQTFADAVGERFVVPPGVHGPQPHLDLRGAAEHRARAAGVGTVLHAAGCTFDGARFASFRRDGARMGSLTHYIVLRA